MAESVIDMIRADHEEIRSLLDRADEAAPSERAEVFRELVQELARHEAAEEAIVHKALRDETPDGEVLADDVLRQESEAEQLLADMDGLDVESDEFLARLETLRRGVLAHAAHEEEHEHPRLAVLGTERLEELGERFERTKAIGPTRPHPHTPQTPEVRAAAGPVAGVFDRMRDKVSDLVGR